MESVGKIYKGRSKMKTFEEFLLATSTALSLRTGHSPKGTNNATYQTCAFVGIKGDQLKSITLHFAQDKSDLVRRTKKQFLLKPSGLVI